MVNDKPVYRVTRRRALEHAGAIAAPLLLAGALPGRGSARQGAASATPGTPQPSPEAIGMVQITHPEKVYFYLPGFQDEAFLAAMYGLDVDTYRKIKSDFAAAAQGVAQELLTDGAFAAAVDRLPFRPGSLVVAIGASGTADLQSWFEILRHLLDLRRPEDSIQLENAAISGQTTAEALGRIGTVVAQRPDWIFCLLGANDAARNGERSTKTEVSVEETERNLLEMRQLASAETGTNWVSMTLPPIDEERMAADPGFRMGGVAVRNADIDRINGFVTRQPGPVVDVNAAFGNPVGSGLLGQDGVHASLAGQTAIARAVVERLAE